MKYRMSHIRRGARRGRIARRLKENGMVAFKWTVILIAVVTVALDGLANLLLATLTTHDVPQVINDASVGLIVVSVLMVFMCHLYERLDNRLDNVVAALVDCVEELELRMGARNPAFA